MKTAYITKEQESKIANYLFERGHVESAEDGARVLTRMSESDKQQWLDMLRMQWHAAY